jgi:hypothetical protein
VVLTISAGFFRRLENPPPRASASPNLPRAPFARPRSPGFFEPRLARSAAIRRVDALRDDALKSHAARVREYEFAVIVEVVSELDAAGSTGQE